MPPSRTRFRQVLPWLILSLLAVGAVIALALLHFTTTRTLHDEGNRARDSAAAEFEQRATQYLRTTRLAVLAELIAFHEEGLAYALERWNESNEVVVDTFLLPPGERVPAHIDAHSHEIEVKPLTALPDLPSDLGYQDENLENIRYAGRTAHPIAGFAASREDPDAPWVIWYRAGPSEPIRGAMVDTTPIMAELQTLLPDPTVAHVDSLYHRLEPNLKLPGFPARNFGFSLGTLAQNRLETANHIGLVAGLLLAGLITGVALLVRQSQRNTRDALRKTTFVSLVSHELRTPITSIRMFADMLADPALPAAKREKFTATIQRESTRLGHLIERLLAFNALEKGLPPPPRHPVELTALIRETIDTATPPLTAAGLTPELTLPTTPVTLATDAETVRQALLNLLDNAAKYAPSSGPLRIQLSTTDVHATLTVTDQGPGVPFSQRERIFEAFVQGHDRLTDKQPGLGLGLALSRAALRTIGGDLTVAPNFPADLPGATFTIRLPLA
ncbi:sensor histidine kinase [Actomonas aquatica]|uniref:histidine kinase n=1 Tax=Actomonas aquatica TaxID=2866162 RepID=A0ABZ1C1Z0_9BACT|nr:HAMP domain-containing sensor histidine kinase [Opitutus sp. WL0086]WRQ85676.1 HAMP domain-containing sensor histidine kinase [Opitutus sp. WL0086]